MLSLPRCGASIAQRTSSCRRQVIQTRLSSVMAAAPVDSSAPKAAKDGVPKPVPIHTNMKRHTNKNLDTSPAPLNVHLAVQRMRDLKWAKFNESVDLAINLGVDPRKPNQSVKGVARLPHGTGKIVRVAVFAAGADATEALAAGADIVGGADLVARIQKGDMPFDTVIATPEMMSTVAKIGRILGPRGLMPNPRMGTVTKEVGKAIIAAKKGAVQFRVDKSGIIHVGVGKLSMSNSQLLDNIRSFMVAVSDSKPEGLKGKYIEAVSVSSTMGAGIPIATQNVDPSSPKFMLDPSKMGIL